jgi:hypothetical protein
MVEANKEVGAILGCGRALYFERGVSGSRIGNQRIVLRDSTFVTLNDSSDLSTEVRCRRRLDAETFRPTDCPLPFGQITAPGLLNDVALLSDGRLLGVGESGLVVSWTAEEMREESVPAPIGRDTLLRVEASSDGDAWIFGQLTLSRYDAASKSWVLLDSIAPLEGDDARPSRGVPLRSKEGSDLAAFRDCAVVATHSQIAGARVTLWKESNWTILSQKTGATAAVHFLPDGRLVVGYAPEDPQLHGWLEVWPNEFGTEHEPEPVELPRATDIFDMDDDGEYLYVVGSGWFAMRIPIESLPFADDVGH